MLCFYQARGPRLRGSIIQIFLLLSVQHLDALFSLPQSVRVDSEIEYKSSDGSLEVYAVEELIDKQDGSIHVRVSDLTNSAGVKELTSYYRLKELSTEFKSINNLVVAYSQTDLLCKSERTSSWHLKELSNIISRLWELENGPEMLAIRDDRTAIGPSTLLQIVQASKHLFTLKLKAFDELHLNDMYYFVATFPLHNNQVAQIICSFPVVSLGDQLKLDESLLSSLNTAEEYPSSVIVAVLDELEVDGVETKSLVTGQSDRLKGRLVANFYLIQERLPSRHMGLKPGALDELNAFTLPASSGCGIATKHTIFYAGANLFSGLFEAKDFKTRRLIAYDGDSSHVRVDSIGKYRVIYDIKQRRLIYIDDTSSPLNEEDKANCAQSYLQNGEEETIFADIRGPEDVMGLAKYTELMYLGKTVLEDGSHCVMFEREITVKQIPLISKLTMRVNARNTNKFFLVFYFIDELSVRGRSYNDGPSAKFSYESLWLKRIELTSVSPISKYKILNSQVTFSESSWSLELASENAIGHKSGSMHSARAFDTVECTSTRSQTQLEFIVGKSDETDDQRGSSTRMGKFDMEKMVTERLDFVEESIMSFLTMHRSLSRSQICELEVLTSKKEGSGKANEQTILVKAKLVEPLDHNIGKQLIGWIYNIDSVPFGKYGTMISSEPMALYECSLKLALLLNDALTVNMLYCPNTGCGYINDMSSLEITSRSSLQPDNYPTSSDNYYLCEVYTQTKSVASALYDILSINTIERLLNGSRISIDTDYLTSAEQSTPNFKGIVVATKATKGLSLNLMGTVLKHGQCYTDQTRAIDDKDFELVIQVLNFDLEHSLVHCHLACQLYAGCQTYSYDKTRRVCTLTNISKGYLVNPSETAQKLIYLKEETKCDLYSIDSIQLYRQVLDTMLNSLEGLCNELSLQCYVTTANLTDCADLCRSNQYNCESFVHFPLHDYCVLEDKGAYLFERLHPDKAADSLKPADRVDWLKRQLGQNQKGWSTYLKSNKYRRDYLKHYAVEQAKKVNLDELPKPVYLEPPAHALDRSSLSYTLMPGPLFYDMDYDSCLRECTIVNPKCMMIDHCLKLINAAPTRICALYELRNTTDRSNSLVPAIGGGGESPLLPSKVGTRIPIDIVPTPGCVHYHLFGDNLWLKIQLMDNFSLDRSQDSGRNMIAAEDLESSVSYAANLGQSGANFGAPKRAAGFSMVLAFFMLVVGLVFGSVSTLYGPRVMTTQPVDGMKTMLASMSLYEWRLRQRAQRSERSQSKIELANIHTEE